MSWSQALQGPEFNALLPWLGRLPPRLAYALSRLRGHFNARFDRDWVSLALGRRHVAPLTLQAMKELQPGRRPAEVLAERYIALAQEEFETRLLAERGTAAFSIDNAEALEQLHARPAGRGLLLMTAHFESFLLGVAALSTAGQRVDLVISEVSADPRLHPSIREHFARKYAGLESWLHGGRALPIETHARHFYEVLRAGGVVVILADAPALSADTGVWIPWMGQQRCVAQGALRMALRTHSILGGFVCHHLELNRHRLELSCWQSPSIGSLTEYQAAYAMVFEFLEQRIRRRPTHWWGAHLLPHYLVQNPSLESLA